MQSGGSLVDSPLSFSADGKYVLCPAGSAVKLFSAETGALLRVLDAHSARVTAVAAGGPNRLQALSTGLDGLILLWDVDEAKVLRAFCLGQPIVDLALHPTLSTTVFVLTAPGETGGCAPTPTYAKGLAFPGRAYSVSLRVTKRSTKRARELAARAADPGDGEAVFGNLERPWPVDPRLLFRAKAHALAVASCGEPTPLVAAVSGAWLTVHDMGDGATGLFRQRRERRAALQCVALSPSERLAATADEFGRIHLWRLDRLTTRDAAARQATGAGAGEGPAREMHWHAQALAALTFSPDGALVLSAGREGVLVFWQTHAAERAFLPRLGAPILGMTTSPDGESLALRGADNTIQLVELAARRVSRVIHGLRRASRIMPDARLRAMVLYGGEAAASLQWWSPTADAHIGSLAAAPANLSGSLPAVGSQRDSRLRSYRDTAAAGGTSAPGVTHAAISPDGTKLATFEVRANAELRQHSCLKLWALRDGAWQLTTRAPQPHVGPLTALAFHPTLLIALTAAHDAKFKLWEAVPPSASAAAPDEAATALPPSTSARPSAPLAAGSAVGSWACRSVGFYRQSAAVAAAFSADGSLLAVAYAPDVITLWEPLSNLLLATLAQPLEPDDALRFLAFPADGGTLLAHSSRAVFCLSLLTSHLLWAYQAQDVVSAAADPASDSALVAVALATPAAPRAPDGHCTAFAILEFGSRGDGEAAAATAAAAKEGIESGFGNVASVPRRVWHLSERPNAVSFLPTAGGRQGVPLCLSGSGELFLLWSPEETAAIQPADGGVGAMSLRHVAPSRLTSLFGSNAVPTAATGRGAGILGGEDDDSEGEESATRRTLDMLAPSALGIVSAVERDAGWEARALDAWMKQHLVAVPSHLLPPVRAIYPHIMDALMLKAPHLVAQEAQAKRRFSESAQGAEGIVSETPASELELHELAAAKAEGRGSTFLRMVELYAPAIRRGKISAAERRKSARMSTGEEATHSDDEKGDEGDGEGARDHRPALRLTLYDDGGSNGARVEEVEASDDDIAVEPAAANDAKTPAAAGTPVAWPPKGYVPFDVCGVPGAGEVIRDVGAPPPPAWCGVGIPAGLSKEDVNFWREHALDEAQLSEIAQWVEMDGLQTDHTDGTASIPLVWEALDQSNDEIWDAAIRSAQLRETKLEGSPDGCDLAAELLAARDLLRSAGLKVDRTRGYGIAKGEMPADMRQPPTPGWQSEPTKLEMKVLAKEFRDGKRGSTGSVIAAALAASDVRVARRAVAQ